MMDLSDKLRNAGVYEYGIVDSRDVEYRTDVRAMCEEDKCHRYAKSWACPPAIGTVDECRDRAWSYDKMLVFSRKFDLEDSYDFEGIREAMKGFKGLAEKLDEELRSVFKEYLILSNEGCGKCESCTYPDAPCRFPDKVHGSIEGYGILVSDLAKLAGVKYYNGKDTVTFFGAVLFSEN
ncbi:MAG: DUF2284 domain-containing protein [Clostridiales bacterium]|nr:DUF2284 domain-containing protein [Clostridiales bacterium]